MCPKEPSPPSQNSDSFYPERRGDGCRSSHILVQESFVLAVDLVHYRSGCACGPPVQFSSVQFSRSVVSDSLRPHESQHARLPCPSALPTKLLLPVPQLFYLCMTACCLFRNFLSVYDCLLPVPQLFISVWLVQCYTLNVQNLENGLLCIFQAIKTTTTKKTPKIMSSDPIASWQIDGKKAEMVATFLFFLNIWQF